MQKRKLQIFLSSTYEDLIYQRLAAMEAILGAGHIPAAMEQFSPGDETAWEKITAWINESDAFILILGGRYGSIEPLSGKSYVQLEYEYAIEKKKPFFALVVSKEHHEERVKQYGLTVDERERQDKYKEFKDLVTQRVYTPWSDKRDIKVAIFQKLPEWTQRPDLAGWIRGDEAASPAVLNELARLSQENHDLRAKAAPLLFEGLTFDQLKALLQGNVDPKEQRIMFTHFPTSTTSATITTVLELFEETFDSLVLGQLIHQGIMPAPLKQFIAQGLVSLTPTETPGVYRCSITENGRRFRNCLRSTQPAADVAG